MPISKRFSTYAERTELAILCALLFVLPTMETAKSLTLMLYGIVWVARRFSLTEIRRFRPDVIETALLAIFIVCAFSTFLNWPFPNGTKGLSDTLRYGLLFWCVYRAGYTERQHETLARVLVAGLLVGLGYAVYELLLDRRPNLELHSVGVLTQSAIYVAIGFMLVFGWLLTRWLSSAKKKSTDRRLWPALLAFVTIGAALLVMGSRGAFVAVGLLVALTVILVNRLKLWMALIAGMLVVAVFVVAAFNSNSSDSVITSFKIRFEGTRGQISNNIRHENFRIALAQIKNTDSPWFGIGPRNYHSIDVSKLHFDPPLQGLTAKSKLNHAHNLFLTKLIEEGVFGLAALLLFFWLIARALYVDWRHNAWFEWRWFAALGALGVPVIAGMVNTPFYQEHAMLAMTLMGMYLSSRRPARNA